MLIRTSPIEVLIFGHNFYFYVQNLAFTPNLHYTLSALLDTNSIDIKLININMSRHLFNQTNAHIVLYALRAKSVYLFDSNFEQDRTSFKSC